MAKRKIAEDYEDENESEMAQGENYVLAIGIQEYVHFEKLPNAVKDVENFIQLMNLLHFELKRKKDRKKTPRPHLPRGDVKR